MENLIICFSCTLKELRVVITKLADWMANSYLLWTSYCALMACHLVALDKSPGVRPVGIVETLLRELAKLMMKSARNHEKTACVNLHFGAGLEAGIEVETHDVWERRSERGEVGAI